MSKHQLLWEGLTIVLFKGKMINNLSSLTISRGSDYIGNQRFSEVTGIIEITVYDQRPPSPLFNLLEGKGDITIITASEKVITIKDATFTEYEEDYDSYSVKLVEKYQFQSTTIIEGEF